MPFRYEYNETTTYNDPPTTVNLYEELLRRSKVKPMTPEDNPQFKIDIAVKEALEKPKREAEEKRQMEEIERRVALAEKIGNNDDYGFGAVLKWTRKLGKDTEFSKAKEYSYAAFKVGDGNWYVTGAQAARTGGWKFHDLVQWMITGENTVENLKVATGWEDIF